MSLSLIGLLSAAGIGLVLIILMIALLISSSRQNRQMLILQERSSAQEQQRTHVEQLLRQQIEYQAEQRAQFDKHQIDSLKLIQDSLHKATQDLREQLTTSLTAQTNNLGKRVTELTQETKTRLTEISGQVDKRLAAGFEKTTATFADVMKRLTIIDQAQQKITELSSNVVSLQEVLTDRKSRGAFGEVQLSQLIRNMIPENHFSLQHTLSNGKRPDCVLFLPEPTGTMVIDAKFPLETYRKMSADKLTDPERKQLATTFRNDIKTHVQHIADKYIITDETADGAIMFIPAEAIFAEIHAHFADVVEYAHQARVWLVSPTTLMAILTTTRAVIKDAATRKQVHIIQEHLIALSKDFTRFQKRMDNLSKHINMAHEDVNQVHKSSQKITSRFDKIEQVELTLEKEEIPIV